ncbi:hypothetical protein LPW11_07705 [Geomonas sp. RF6]|uniref:hypothetical protein n=1 Tax=Geomonas sp. RF6 TaxID=2897342 RepID=UPI001E348CAA|nr:hypothetical protein [Geomonas sp. RF6]UFS72067.1 hypothetical protein LPW11_07705 [Geomonas sp. RF6]
MSTSRFFPEPWHGTGLSAAIATEALDLYGADILAASRGDRDNIAKRNETYIRVKAMMEKLCHYCEIVAGDNMEALRSSGFELRRQRGKAASSSPTKAVSEDAPLERPAETDAQYQGGAA